MAQMPLFNLIFLGLGWPWVGEFVGFMKISIRFPTQQNLVNRKHRNRLFGWKWNLRLHSDININSLLFSRPGQSGSMFWFELGACVSRMRVLVVCTYVLTCKN